MFREGCLAIDEWAGALQAERLKALYLGCVEPWGASIDVFAIKFLEFSYEAQARGERLRGRARRERGGGNLASAP